MDTDMAGIEHPGEKKGERDPHDGDKRGGWLRGQTYSLRILPWKMVRNE